MIYHPTHFHGISHEQDVHWLFNLPKTILTIVGDGITTRYRLKFEARKLGRRGGQLFMHDVNSRQRNVTIDEDSHYINLSHPLLEGQVYEVEYYYVNPL